MLSFVFQIFRSIFGFIRNVDTEIFEHHSKTFCIVIIRKRYKFCLNDFHFEYLKFHLFLTETSFCNNYYLSSFFKRQFKEMQQIEK